MERPRSAQPWALWPQHALVALIALLCAASLFVLFTTDSVLQNLLDFLGLRLFFVLVYGAIGYLITVRRPDLLVGWLVLGAAVLLAASALSNELGLRSLQPGADVPGGALAAWPGFWLAPAGFATLFLALPVFPDGPLRARRWRIAFWAQVVLGVAGTALVALVPHRSLVTGLPDPIAIGALALVPRDFHRLRILLALASIVLGLGSLVARYHGATTMVRQQIKWAIAAGTLYSAISIVQIIAITFLWLGILGPTNFAENVIGGLVIPAAIGIGILRYRLFDIDLVINRALVYGGVSAILAGAFAGLSSAAQYILRSMTGQQSEIVSIALAVLAAIAFTPLKTRANDRGSPLEGRPPRARGGEPYRDAVRVTPGAHVHCRRDGLVRFVGPCGTGA